jgi:hypothetical protein
MEGVTVARPPADLESQGYQRGADEHGQGEDGPRPQRSPRRLPAPADHQEDGHGRRGGVGAECHPGPLPLQGDVVGVYRDRGEQRRGAVERRVPPGRPRRRLDGRVAGQGRAWRNAPDASRMRPGRARRGSPHHRNANVISGNRQQPRLRRVVPTAPSQGHRARPSAAARRSASGHDRPARHEDRGRLVGGDDLRGRGIGRRCRHDSPGAWFAQDDRAALDQICLTHIHST